MRTSIVPSYDIRSAPHVVVIGNQKGGSGKSTFAMHIIVALLNAGKRVACFDLDLNQLTLSRYVANRRAWEREHEQQLLSPDHYPVTEEDARRSQGDSLSLRQLLSQIKPRSAHKELIESGVFNHSADLNRFIAQLYEIGRARRHDFIIIDTPGGVQHLNLVAHGMADTLITPVNDSLLDLDVLVAMERSDLEPQPSVYAEMVWRALDARRNVSGRATDWIVVRNRLESVESNNHRQITRVLEVIQRTLDFRIAPGLRERPVYREFFAAGLTVLDSVEEFTSAAESNSSARVEVEDLMRQIGLIENDADLEAESLPQLELQIAEANEIDRDKIEPVDDLVEPAAPRPSRGP
jgi:chromosome partitioning protein